MTLLFNALLMLATDPVFAKNLQESAKAANSNIQAIAQITSTIGIALGGIMMSLGATSLGKTILGGAIIGAIASFAGPAIMEFFKSVFT